MLDFKRGQTFDFTGQVLNGTSPFPLANCTLRCDLRTRIGFAFVQALTVQFVNAATGVVRIFAPPAQTARWKVTPHLLDLQLVDGAGNVIISNTEEINVIDRVTQ